MECSTTLERPAISIREGMSNIGASEVLCWPYEGRVLAVLNQDGNVTHALPEKMPEDGRFDSQKHYFKSVIQDIGRYGKVTPGVIVFMGGRYYFRKLSS